MITTEPIPLSLAGVRALRWRSDAPHTAMKEAYTVGQMLSGRSTFWYRGKVWKSGPGALQLKQPDEVHRDLSGDGPAVFQVITLAPSLVERRSDRIQVHPLIDPGDPRAAPFLRLLQAVRDGVDRLALEVAVEEAIEAFTSASRTTIEHSRPVQLAIGLLRERLAESISLDQLEAHASLDKFHLCRAFRAQVGMPPHAYLIRLRIMRAKELLASGVRVTEVALRVGFYDQSQLTRHFRRIVGITPGEYARRL